MPTLMASIWATVELAALLRPGHPVGTELILGMTIFCGLLTSHMRTIARRVLDGIGLQLRNASLARQLSAALQLVQHEAGTDALTGQPNRRALDELLRQQVSVAQATGRAFSVLLLDIDHFKLVNDTHGHGPATTPCARSRSACASTCARATPARATAARNSSSCCRAPRWWPRSRWPSGCARAWPRPR